MSDENFSARLLGIGNRVRDAGILPRVAKRGIVSRRPAMNLEVPLFIVAVGHGIVASNFTALHLSHDREAAGTVNRHELESISHRRSPRF
jgi:hypothetical protein